MKLSSISQLVCLLIIFVKKTTMSLPLRYPVGIQTFSKIREEGFLYVDKTEYIYRLSQGAGYFFLARPRRFGKSLLISTLDALYSGRKDLFEGLWIADKWDWSKSFPVIYIPFNAFNVQEVGLEQSLYDCVYEHASNFGVTLENQGVGRVFEELIRKIHAKTNQKVVVLIDEYDKPIIDFLEDMDVAEQNRQLLKSFYGILKPADPHLHFVLLTGVSKFSKISIFSDLNNLRDISLDKNFGAITGITQNELQTYFASDISALAQEKKQSEASFLAQIKHWYNGYTWDLNTRVYNPFSILRFFEAGGDLQNFWFETGTPTFLIKQLYKHFAYNFSQIESSEFQINTFDYSNLDPITLLYQTGYLTIQSYSFEDHIYILDYPNEEVRLSLNQYLLKTFRQDEFEEVIPMVVRLRNALKDNDLERVMSLINAIFSSLPYDLWQNESERFYHALIHLTFTLLGTYIQSEVHTSNGRCDALIHTPSFIYAFEFKLNRSAEEAMNQIKNRGYLAPYTATGKQLIAVGVNFTTEKKGIDSWLSEYK